MKKRLALLSRALFCSVVFLLSSYSAMAQMPQPEVCKVKGILLDSLTNDGEPYATLRLALKTNINKPDKVAVTDTKGAFSLEVSKVGHYVLTVSSVGKTTLIRDVIFTAANKTIDLGKLFIAENKHQLGNVTVTAQKPLVKVDLDKLEYDVKSDPQSKTSRVLDMLRKVPMVTVDGQDKILVNGSENFKIFINGKPSTLLSTNPSKVLKGMPASSIKNIEVITNPGAKYDAEGVGGILNIVMDDDSGLQGYTATLNTSVDNRSIDGGAYAMVQKGKLTLATNINTSKDFGRNLEDVMTTENLKDDTNKYLSQNGKTKNIGIGMYGSFEASYEFSKSNLLSTSFNMYGGKYTADSYQKSVMKNNLFDDVYRFTNVSNTDMKYKYYEGKVDYQHTFAKPGEMLTLSFRMSNSPTNNDNYLSLIDVYNYSPYKQNSFSKMSSPEYTYQVDYTKPMFKTGSLQTGVKYISRSNISESKVEKMKEGDTDFSIIPNGTMDYNHKQDIWAGYLSYQQKIGKMSAKAGVRYENSTFDAKTQNKPEDDLKKTFSDLVPSASIAYQLAMTKTVRLSYNMGIRRPSIWFLNPYRNTSNPSVISYGNPDLTSEKNHSFNLNFSSFSQNFNLNVGLGHSFVNNSIQRYSFMNDKSVMETTYANIGKARSTNLSLYMSWMIFPKTNVSVNEAISYRVIESKEGLANLNSMTKNSGFENNLFGNIQQTFGKNLVLSLNGGFSTSRIALQGTNTGYSHYTFSLNKSFLKEDRLTVGAYATNIFTKDLEFGSENKTPTFIQSSKSYYPMRSFGVSVSYRLGKLKAQVKKASRSIVNDDVLQGGNSQGGGEKK